MLCGTKGKKAGTQTNSCFLALILLSFIRQQWTNFWDPNWKKHKEPTQTAWCFFTNYTMKLWSTKRLVNERSKNIILYIAVSTGSNIMQTLNVLARFPDQNHSPPQKKNSWWVPDIFTGLPKSYSNPHDKCEKIFVTAESLTPLLGYADAIKNPHPTMYLPCLKDLFSVPEVDKNCVAQSTT